MTVRRDVAAWRRTLLSITVGSAATAIVLLGPALRLGYRDPGTRIALETAAAMIAGLVGLLLYGRYRRDHRVRDLLLVYAMALLGVTAFLLAVRPGLLGDEQTRALGVWLAPVARVLGAGLILAAAMLPEIRVQPHSRRPLAVIPVAVAACAVPFLLAALDWRAPGLVEVTTGTGDLLLQSHPTVITFEVITLPCYALAGLIFTYEASRDGDDLLGWFGAAAAVGALSRANYLMAPTQYTEWISVGDVLRLGFFMLLLVGALREIQAYWAAQAVAAAESERRRLARDLHDGVVQELGYIRSRASSSRPSGEGMAADILAATDRAVDEARRAVDALTADPGEDLADALRRTAGEVGDRYDVAMHVSLEPVETGSDSQRDALVRITREALLNAARHGHPDGIWVALTSAGLTIRDDGKGFDPEGRLRRGAFGLIGMQERAASVGAKLHIASSPGCGTTVRITW